MITQFAQDVSTLVLVAVVALGARRSRAERRIGRAMARALRA